MEELETTAAATPNMEAESAPIPEAAPEAEAPALPGVEEAPAQEPASEPLSEAADQAGTGTPDESEAGESPSDSAAVSVEDLLGHEEAPETAGSTTLGDAPMKAVLEAIIYVTEEPLSVAQMAAAFSRSTQDIQALLDQLAAEFERPEHGIAIRLVAGGYKMATKAEHHDAVRSFVKSLKPPLKLSLAALETLAVIAYKQPVTSPEVLEIRGVQGGSVIKTLLDRKLIAAAGRKNVIGKPILYKTTKEFLIQFGLKDLSELPTLKEFEELRRLAFSETEPLLAGQTIETPAEEQPVENALVPADQAPEAPIESAAGGEPVPDGASANQEEESE
jgi:segregation and condensation protein B